MFSPIVTFPEIISRNICSSLYRNIQLMALKLKINNCTRLDDTEYLIQGVILEFLDSLRRSLFSCENMIFFSSVFRRYRKLRKATISFVMSVRPSA
jgi:hypothetical protein